MAEYIEREKLIKDLKNNADYKSECGFKQDIDIESLINYLKKLPSADVVKVVRCKDCKHWIYWADQKDVLALNIIFTQTVMIFAVTVS